MRSARSVQASEFADSPNQPSSSGQNEEPPPPYESVVMSTAVSLHATSKASNNCLLESCFQSMSLIWYGFDRAFQMRDDLHLR